MDSRKTLTDPLISIGSHPARRSNSDDTVSSLTEDDGDATDPSLHHPGLTDEMHGANPLSETPSSHPSNSVDDLFSCDNSLSTDNGSLDPNPKSNLLLLILTLNIAIPLELVCRATQHITGHCGDQCVVKKDEQDRSINQLERYMSFGIVAFSFAPTLVYVQALYHQENNWFAAMFPFQPLTVWICCVLVVDFNLYGYLQLSKQRDRRPPEDSISVRSSWSPAYFEEMSWLTTALVVALDGFFFAATPIVMAACQLSRGEKPVYSIWIALCGWYTNAIFNCSFVRNPANNGNLGEGIAALFLGFFSIYNQIQYLEVVSCHDLGCSDTQGGDDTLDHYRQQFMWLMYCTTIPRLSYILGDNIVSTLKQLSDSKRWSNMHDCLAKWSIVGFGWNASSLPAYKKCLMNVAFLVLYPIGMTIYSLSQGAGDGLGKAPSDVERVISYVATALTVLSCVCILQENNVAMLNAAVCCFSEKLMDENTLSCSDSNEIHVPGCAVDFRFYDGRIEPDGLADEDVDSADEDVDSADEYWCKGEP